MNLKIIFLFFCLFFCLFSSLPAGESLVLYGRDRLYDESIEDKALLVESLEILDGWSSREMYFYQQFRNEDLSYIAYRFPNLKKLHLHQITEMTDDALNEIHPLKHLESLVIDKFRNLTDKGLAAISKSAPQLKELVMILLFERTS